MRASLSRGRFGGHERKDFLDHELIVISPGMASDHPLLREARQNGARVIGEIELASRFIEEPIIAVTGTNGKTTTTTLLGRLFDAASTQRLRRRQYRRPPRQLRAERPEGGRYVIVEISSFQLETIETFRPATAILLNITEDHLDRYAAFADYVAAKMRIFENQTPDDQALVSAEIGPTGAIRARRYCFSTRSTLDEGAFLQGRPAPRAPRRQGILLQARPFAPRRHPQQREPALRPAHGPSLRHRAGGNRKDLTGFPGACRTGWSSSER